MSTPDKAGSGTRGMLEGIRVIDLTRAMAGPYATLMLADHGADVIKIETGSGDGTRRWPPFSSSGESLYFSSINRNKRSVHLDLRSTHGRSALESLLTDADVVVENFRPGVMDDMGFAASDLRNRHPELIVASISAYGRTGPDSAWPGLDQIAQAMSGLMSVTGTDESGPLRYGVPIIDITSGMFLAFAIAAALHQRDRTGEGAHVATSLMESAYALLTFQAQEFLSNGTVPAPAGNNHPVMAPYGVFHTQDRPITVAVAFDEKWDDFARVIGAPELLTRDEYQGVTARVANRALLTADIERRLRTRPAEEWIPLIRRAGIPAGPINDIAGALAEPQVEATAMIHTLPGRHGATRVLRTPISVDGVAPPPRTEAPQLGADTAQLLTEGVAR